MGGIHVSSRGTYSKKYIGVKSDLMLPRSISSSRYAGIKPEFILGMYSGRFGLDTGVLYEDGHFKLFYWSLDGTCSPQGNTDFPIIRYASVGDKITLKTYLNGDDITCKAFDISTNKELATLNAPLTSSAKIAFQSGAYINREIVIAANPSGVVNPCNIYFYDAEFYNGYVTDKRGNRHDLNDDVSKITKDRDPEITNGRFNIDVSKIKKMYTQFGTDSNRSFELATCDLS